METFRQNPDGRPMVVYHATNRLIDRFWPLTHFGTAQAALERWSGAHSNNIGSQIYPCLLNMSNPLRIEDSGDIDIYFGARELIQAGVPHEQMMHVYQPLLHSPITRKEFMAAAEHAHSWTDFNPNDCLKEQRNIDRNLRYIFSVVRDDLILPMSIKNIERELLQETLYDFMPDQNASYSKRAQKLLRHWLKDQRKIIALEALGYDGLVYENMEEDAGEDSYCIFRPEQVHPAAHYNWGPSGMPKPATSFDRGRVYIPTI